MIFLILPLLYFCVADTSKAVHLGSLQVYEQDSVVQPSEVERIRLRVTKTTTDGFSDSVVVHILRLQWTTPRFWNDEDDSSDRSFNVICEADESRNNETFSLIDVKVSADVTAIHERFVLPPVPLSLICAVRTENSKKIEGEWKYSPMFLIDSSTDQKKTVEMTRVQDNEINRETIEDLKEQLKTAKLIEIPFPTMKQRDPVRIHPRKQKSKAKSKTTTNVTTSSESPTDTEATTIGLKNDDIAPAEAHLFLRGLSLKPSDFLSEEDHAVQLPPDSNIFGKEEDMRMAPTEKLSKEIESDYDLLEQRIREVIGSLHDRVL